MAHRLFAFNFAEQLQVYRFRGYIGQFGARQHLNEAPALVTRDRTRFHNAHSVAHLRILALVVDHQAANPADVLLVEPVSEVSLHGHEDCFLHLVANYGTVSHLATAVLTLPYCHLAAPLAEAARASCFSR